MQVLHTQLRLRTTLLILLVLGSFCCVAVSAQAQFTEQVNYQGKLNDSAGVPVSNGDYEMRFTIYDAPSAGTNLWDEVVTVTVTDGLFSHMLGSSSTLSSIDWNQDLYLGIEIDGDGEMTPRKQLGAVPAAFEARQLGGVASSSFLRSDVADTMSATTTSALLTLQQNGAGNVLSALAPSSGGFLVTNEGRVALGDAASFSTSSLNQSVATIYEIFDSPATDQTVLDVTGSVGAAASSTTGIKSYMNVDSINVEEVIAGDFTANNNSGSDLDNMFGLRTTVNNNDSGSLGIRTVANSYGIYSDVVNGAGLGTTTNAYGGFFQVRTVGGVIENGYGLYIQDVSANNDFGLYQAGSSDTNFFAGDVGIGSTTPSSKLTVAGDTYVGGALRATGSVRFDALNSPGAMGLLFTDASGVVSTTSTSSLGLGTVTSVDASVPTGWTISGNPITNSGTLAFAYDTGYGAVLTASTTNWNNFYNTPSTRITAGTGLSWAGNTIDLDNDFGASIDESELNIAVGPTNGYVLQASSTAVGGFVWTATSSLGLGNPFGNSINANELANEDFGDFSCNGTTCSFDADTVGASELASGIPVTTFTNDAGYLTSVDLSGSSILDLADTPGSFTGGGILYESGSQMVFDSDFTYNGSNLVLGNTTGISLGGDVLLNRGAANRLDVASGDSLNLASGTLQVGGTNVVDASRRIFTAGGTLGAGTLAYSFSTDTDTGLYNPSTDTLRFVTNGSDRLSITDTGNVGIGTSSPASKLDVWGDFRVGTSSVPLLSIKPAEQNITLGTWDASGGMINFGLDDDVASTGVVYGVNEYIDSSFTTVNNSMTNSGAGSIDTALTYTGNRTLIDFIDYDLGSSADLTMYGDDIDISFSDDSGIYGPPATINAAAIQTIYGSRVRIQSGADGADGTSTAYGYYADVADADITYSFYAADGNAYFADNVGIGSSTPSSKLTVIGDTYIGGALRATGTVRFDALASAASDGLLLTDASGNVSTTSTSTLGLGDGTFLGLSDTPGSFNANRLLFTNSGGNALTDSANLTYNGSTLNLGGPDSISWGGTNVLSASTTRNNYLFGEGAGASLTTGSENIFIGTNAGNSVETAINNVMIGWLAGQDSTGFNSTFIGAQAGRSFAGGAHNTAIGSAAGANIVSGAQNTLLGQGAGTNFGTTSDSVVIGYNAAGGGTGGSADGINNVIIGARAGNLLTNGFGSVLIGAFAGDNITSGISNIVIGYNIDAPSATASNQLNIGNLIFGTGIDGTGTTLSSGNIGIATTTPSQRLTVDGGLRVTGPFVDSASSTGSNGQVLLSTVNGTAWTATSSLGLGNPFGNSINANELANEDFGDFSCNGTTCSFDADTVGASELASGIPVTTFTNDAGYLTSVDLSGSSILDLADTPGSFTGGGILYESGSQMVFDSDFTYNGSNLVLGNTTGISLGGDVLLNRGAANRLDVASGDSLNLASGTLQVGGTNVVDASRRIFTAGGTLGAGTLAYSFSTDTDTGLYNPSTDTLRFVTNGSDRLSITDTGNVGIGTTSPSSKLTVAGDTYIGGALRATGTVRFDALASAASDGLLLTDANGNVSTTSTSTLGLGDGTFLGLSDTPGSFTANRLLFTNSGGNALTDSADLTYNGSTLNLGGSDSISWGGTNVLSASTTRNNYLFGEGAGASLTSGSEHILIGTDAGNSLVSDVQSVMIGWQAGRNTPSGGTFIGAQAGQSFAGGVQNTAVGTGAGVNVVSGSANTFLGHGSGSNFGTTSNSVIIGGANGGTAGASSGIDNTIVGSGAGRLLTNGFGSVLIGASAGDNITSGLSNIVIGYNIDAPSATASNQLNIGNLLFGTGIDGTGTALSSGNIGIGTSSPASKLDVWGDFRVGTSSVPTLFTDVSIDRVGIGTDAPTSTLHIEDSAPIVSIFSDTNNTDSSIQFRGYQSGDLDRGFNIAYLDSGTNNFAIQRYTGTTQEVFSIERDTGDVGISVTNPSAQLHVKQIDTGDSFRVDDTTGIDLSPFIIDQVGDVGIGTTTPSSKLDVWGDFRVGTSSTPTLFAQTGTGRVGIGTSSPVATFAVDGTSAFTGQLSLLGSNANIALGDNWLNDDGDDNEGIAIDSTGAVTFRKSTVAMHAITIDNPSASSNTGRGINFMQSGNVTGYLYVVADGDFDNHSMQFHTRSGGVNSERMRITGSGNFAVGTTSDLARLSVQSNSTNDILNLYETGGQEVFTVLENGNVGIGTTTPYAKLGLENTGLTGNVTGGINQYIGFENSTTDAVLYGDRTFINATNTATSTMVGGIIRLADRTTFGNTVRGFEVQTNRGGNTQGENTALSGFARTFGVRGFSSGDAGGSFEPAGGYFETGGTSQGNAIRGYSETITTADLLSLFHSSSSFAGTGLAMDFGNGSGSFSSSTASRFVDLKNAGNSKFIVYNDGRANIIGTTTIGTGDTSQVASLQIGYGSLCVDDDGTCNASTTAGTVTAVAYETANSDLAEMYFSSQNLKPGELVVSDSFLSVERATNDRKADILGVISTKPGLTLGSDDSSLVAGQRGYPLALTGRVPVRLSTENGPIAPGDPLTLSSIPGVAMKATEADVVVGRALEAFDGTRAYTEGYINQFGDDIAEPDYSAVEALAEVRTKADCYYGAGGATGAEEVSCDPADVTATTTDVAEQEAIAQARYEAEMAALEALRDEPAEYQTVEDETVGVGQIIMFVDRGYHLADEQLAVLNELTSTSSELVLGATEDSGETLWSRLKELAQNFVDGVLTVAGIKTERVETQELCVEDVCVTADDLRALLDGAATSPSEPTNGETGTSEDPADVVNENPEPDSGNDSTKDTAGDAAVGASDAVDGTNTASSTDDTAITTTNTTNNAATGGADDDISTTTADTTLEAGNEPATTTTVVRATTSNDTAASDVSTEAPEAPEAAASDTTTTTTDTTEPEPVTETEDSPESASDTSAAPEPAESTEQPASTTGGSSNTQNET